MDPVIVVGSVTRAVAVYIVVSLHSSPAEAGHYAEPNRPLNLRVLTIRYAIASTIQMAMIEPSSTRPMGGAITPATCSQTSRISSPLVHANGVPYSLRRTFSQSNSEPRSVLESPPRDGSHRGTRRA